MAKKHSDSELRKVSDHLLYEIWMMNRLAAILEGSAPCPLPTPLVSYTHSQQTTIIIRSTRVIKSTKIKENEDDVPRVINNAIIEAFAIHVRSLLDFFYSKGKDDDVVAEHFFSSPSTWINVRPPKTEDELRRIKYRVNKEIAHLTFARQEVKSKIWPSKPVQKDINEVLEVFSSLAPKNLLGSRWK